MDDIMNNNNNVQNEVSEEEELLNEDQENIEEENHSSSQIFENNIDNDEDEFRISLECCVCGNENEEIIKNQGCLHTICKNLTVWVEFSTRTSDRICQVCWTPPPSNSPKLI